MIPARGGSKGIPRKSLVPLAGRPLIEYTTRAALESSELARVVLSTDDLEIAEVGRGLGVDVPFMRPASIAGDTAPMIDVAEHALAELGRQGERYEAILLLQPTSPLRTATHIDEAVRQFRETETDAVIGVSVPSEHPYEMVTFRDEGLQPVIAGAERFSRRQDFPEFHFVNGAIYLVSASALMRERTLLPRRSIPYLMSRRDSLEIDVPFDLELAECLLGMGTADAE